MSEEQGNQQQELGVLAQKIQSQKGPKPRKFVDEDEENAENMHANPITGEIDSQSIQAAQHNNSFIYTLFPGFQVKSLTCVLIVLFLVVYIFMGIEAGKLELPVGHKMRGMIQDKFVTLEMGCVLHRHGGRFCPDLYENNGYWRLVTSIFVHGDLMQLSVNIFSLMMLGYQLEKYLGTSKYALCLVIGGTLGNLASQYFHNDEIYSGACQCIFALYGMQGYNLKEHFAYLGENRKKMGKHFLWVIGATFFLFLLDRQIDFLGLPAALAVGFLVAWFLNKDLYEKVPILVIHIVLLVAYIAVLVFLIGGLEKPKDLEYPCDVWDLADKEDEEG